VAPDAVVPGAWRHVTRVLAFIERSRQRLWAICYRMTGSRAEADDLCQEAIARALERADEATADDPTGWLVRMTTRLCLDHLRHRKVERRLVELVDPLDVPELPAGVPSAADPERASILREDVRYAVVVALQHLTPRQRSALILRDICDLSLEDVAATLETTENSTKALLHRARTALADARRQRHVDVPCDATVVERFARAIEEGSVERLAELLAEDAWGVVDGGGIVPAAKKPNFGRRAISRQWENGRRKLGQAVSAGIRRINGESAIVIRLAAAPDIVVAIVHLETHEGSVVALRVNRDPRRIAYLGVPLQ
jgi:RNA polymerase sigma-70 factor (ECF subfamily)